LKNSSNARCVFPWGNAPVAAVLATIHHISAFQADLCAVRTDTSHSQPAPLLIAVACDRATEHTCTLCAHPPAPLPPCMALPPSPKAASPSWSPYSPPLPFVTRPLLCVTHPLSSSPGW
jgi:hypothetical protein